MQFELKRDKIIIFLIAIFFLLLPLYIGPTIRYIFSGLIIILCSNSIVQNKKQAVLIIFNNPLYISLLVLLAIAFFACFFSPDFFYSLRHVFTEYFLNILLFSVISQYFFLYNAKINFVKILHYINLAFIILYLGLLIQWMLMPKQPFLFDSEYNLSNFTRSDLFFLFGNACDLFTTIKHISLFLALMIAASYSNIVLNVSVDKKFSLALLFINLFILFNTTRRGAMLASFIGMGFSTFMVKQYKNYFIYASLFLMLLLSLFFITDNKGYIVRENWGLILKGNIEEAKRLGGSIPLRISTYKTFLYEIKKSPFTPNGPSMKLFKIYHPDLIKKAGLSHGHNVFIDYALQFGIQGALTLMFIISYQFIEYLKAFKITTKEHVKALMLTAMSFLVIFWTINMFTDGFIHGSSTFYWLFSAISYGYARKSLENDFRPI